MCSLNYAEIVKLRPFAIALN